MIRRSFLFALLFISLRALGDFTLPDLSTEEKTKTFITQIEIEAPWMKGDSRSIVSHSTVLIPKLLQNPLWQKLALARGAPVELLVDVVAPVEQQVREVKPDTLERWKREAPEPDLKLILETMKSELEWLVNHDSRALVTGIINSLPQAKRAPLFRAGTIREQLQLLRAEEQLTDAAVGANFRAADFAMDANSISKEGLLSLLEESQNREENFVNLLRSAWFLSGGLDLDFFGREPAEQKQFTEGILEIAVSDKRKAAFLQKLAKSYYQESDYQITAHTVDSTVRTYRALEVSPVMGATRGWLMADCSREAFAFAYSPQEYVYLIYDETNKPIAFIAATHVLSGDKNVLYVHDFGGPSAEKDLVQHVIHGFYQALGQLGFQQMTVSVVNNNLGPWTQVARPLSGPAIQQIYPDAEFRLLIQSDTRVAHSYDLPTHNSEVPSFVPNKLVLASTRARVIRRGSALDAQSFQSKPASILQALAIFNANPEAGVTNEMLKIDGVQAQDIFALFGELKNDQRLPLDKYYLKVGETFEKYKINLSNHFIRDNAHLFQEGHLKAQDAATVQDSALFNRTVSYVTQTLKSQKNADLALGLVKAHLEHFMANDRFKAYLKTFTGRGQNEGVQLAQLMEIGLTFEHLNQDADALLRFVNSASPAIRYWALKNLPKSELLKLPAEAVRKIASDLELDHDEYPRLASKFLLDIRSQDPEVLKQLQVTVEEEEAADIVLRSALAMHLNGHSDPQIIRESYKKAEQAQWLDVETANLAEQVIAKLSAPTADCAKVLRR
jgi:hypothetical protein